MLPTRDVARSGIRKGEGKQPAHSLRLAIGLFLYLTTVTLSIFLVFANNAPAVEVLTCHLCQPFMGLLEA